MSEKKKPVYEPPTIFPIGGSVAYAQGPCRAGGSPAWGNCRAGGVASGGGDCRTGSIAGDDCRTGSIAGDDCRTGSAAGDRCRQGGTASRN